MKILSNISKLFVLSIVILSCSKEKKQASKKIEIEYSNYAKTILPKDTTKLWLSEGSIKSDTVLIMGDGGPKNQLDYEFNGKISMSYLKNFKNYYAVNLHQSSTYNKDIFNWKDEFTMDMAKIEVDNSSEIMYRAIKYFKDRNKYVIVKGHSYSAFIIPHYVATRPSLADKYLITSGRLIADSLQTVYQQKNVNTIFEEGGIKIQIPDESRPPNPNRTRRYFKIRQAKNYLKAAIGQIDYTEALAEKDISNWVFVYGNNDRNVGVPSTKELNFLKNKGVNVIEAESDHYNIYKTLIDNIENGEIKL